MMWFSYVGVFRFDPPERELTSPLATRATESEGLKVACVILSESRPAADFIGASTTFVMAAALRTCGVGCKL